MADLIRGTTPSYIVDFTDSGVDVADITKATLTAKYRCVKTDTGALRPICQMDLYLTPWKMSSDTISLRLRRLLITQEKKSIWKWMWFLTVSGTEHRKRC